MACREALKEASVDRLEEERVQDINDNGEQHGGDGVSLSEAASVVDRRARVAVGHDPCRRGGEKD